MSAPPAVRELRLVVTAPDFDEALAFYRDVLGLSERLAYSSAVGKPGVPMRWGNSRLRFTVAP